MKSFSPLFIILISIFLVGCPRPPVLPPPNPARVGEPTKNYSFRLVGIAISNTRSKHTDTDYISCGLSVNGKAYPPIVKALGDLNNGTYLLNLTIGPVAIAPSDVVIYNYCVVNNGSGNQSQNINAISVGTTAALETQASSYDDPSDPDNANDSSGEPWVSIFKAITQLGVPLLFPNCDGVVVKDEFRFSGSKIDDLIKNANIYVVNNKFYAGSNSPSGCGSNSKYNVSWTIISAP
jgi:hypothetical protein